MSSESHQAIPADDETDQGQTPEVLHTCQRARRRIKESDLKMDHNGGKSSLQSIVTGRPEVTQDHSSRGKSFIYVMGIPKQGAFDTTHAYCVMEVPIHIRQFLFALPLQPDRRSISVGSIGRGWDPHCSGDLIRGLGEKGGGGASLTSILFRYIAYHIGIGIHHFRLMGRYTPFTEKQLLLNCSWLELLLLCG